MCEDYGGWVDVVGNPEAAGFLELVDGVGASVGAVKGWVVCEEDVF